MGLQFQKETAAHENVRKELESWVSQHSNVVPSKLENSDPKNPAVLRALNELSVWHHDICVMCCARSLLRDELLRQVKHDPAFRRIDSSTAKPRVANPWYLKG